MIRKLLEFCIAAAVLAFLAGCLQGQLLRFSSGESVRVPECISEQNGIEESSEMVQSSTEKQKTIPGNMSLRMPPVSAELVLRTEHIPGDSAGCSTVSDVRLHQPGTCSENFFLKEAERERRRRTIDESE